MHYTGLGTYQSCSLAKNFIQHVANVGQHALLLKKAHTIVAEGKHRQAALTYIELAEAGISTAQLNAGTLLNKHKVFDETYFSHDLHSVSIEKGRDGDIRVTRTLRMEMNSHLAFNFFKMALTHMDTRDEAVMKLAEYYYYGLSPLE